MNTPGFTAEAAIYDSSTMYEMTGATDAPAKGAVVAPQLGGCKSIGPCRICVNFSIFPPRACVRLTCFGSTLLNRCVP